MPRLRRRALSRKEADPLEAMLVYWMGRFHGVVSGAPQPPVALSVVPASGSGATAAFRFDIWDPNGYQDVTVGLIVINSVLSASRSCYLYYDRAQHTIRLANDAGNSWMGPLTDSRQGVRCLV